MVKLRGRHLTKEERLKEMKDYAKQMCQSLFNDLDNSWSSKKIDYKKHKCDGMDGSDISFTKKDFERIREIYC